MCCASFELIFAPGAIPAFLDTAKHLAIIVTLTFDFNTIFYLTRAIIGIIFLINNFNEKTDTVITIIISPKMKKAEL
jgi:hypothetical protein